MQQGVANPNFFEHSVDVSIISVVAPPTRPNQGIRDVQVQPKKPERPKSWLRTLSTNSWTSRSSWQRQTHRPQRPYRKPPHRLRHRHRRSDTIKSQCVEARLVCDAAVERAKRSRGKDPWLRLRLWPLARQIFRTCRGCSPTCYGPELPRRTPRETDDAVHPRRPPESVPSPLLCPLRSPCP